MSQREASAEDDGELLLLLLRKIVFKAGSVRARTALLTMGIDRGPAVITTSLGSLEHILDDRKKTSIQHPCGQEMNYARPGTPPWSSRSQDRVALLRLVLRIVFFVTNAYESVVLVGD